VQREISEKSAAHTLSRLKHFLADEPDVLVTGRNAWDALPDEARTDIWKRVQDGMGLVYGTPTKTCLTYLKAQAKVGEKLTAAHLAVPAAGC